MWRIVSRWSLCLLDITVSLAKTAEPIEMPFRIRTRVGQRNHIFDGSLDPPRERGALGVSPTRL